MGSIPVGQFPEHPDRLLSQAQGGEISVITKDGEPVFMAVPMGAQLDIHEVRIELAISLFVCEQISTGVAARIAGESISDFIDKLGNRRIPVTSYSGDECEEELQYVRSLGCR